MFPDRNSVNASEYPARLWKVIRQLEAEGYGLKQCATGLLFTTARIS